MNLRTTAARRFFTAGAFAAAAALVPRRGLFQDPARCTSRSCPCS